MAVTLTHLRSDDSQPSECGINVNTGSLNQPHNGGLLLMHTANKTTAETIAAEGELIQRILAGQRDLYHDLVAPYERMVYVSALALLRNEFDAEDCAQDAFLKAFRRLAEFKGECKFGSWLVRVALNEAKLRLRKLR